MAVHLSIGRNPSIFLLALFAVAAVAGTAHYLTRSEAETVPASQITVIVPMDAVAEAEPAVAAGLEATPAPDAVQTVSIPPAASIPPAHVVTEPQDLPVVEDPVLSTLRPKNLAPIPMRAPRAANADWIAARKAAMLIRTGTPSAAKSSTAGASNRAATLFKSGAEIKIKKDANVYITSRNIPENDRLLGIYNADRPNGGRVQTRVGEATAVPGLLGIANQAYRAQDPNGRNAEAYSLADAMRDAVWRKNTAARLKSLTTAQNACVDGAGGAAKNLPSIGLVASC